MYGSVNAPLKGMFPLDSLKRLETFLYNVFHPTLESLELKSY